MTSAFSMGLQYAWMIESCTCVVRACMHRNLSRCALDKCIAIVYMYASHPQHKNIHSHSRTHTHTLQEIMSGMKEIYLVSVKSGNTRSGLIADITEVMAPFKARVLDIAQSEIHEMLSLGMLIEVAREESQAEILKSQRYRQFV